VPDVHSAVGNGTEAMTDIQEKDIAAQIEEEAVSNDGLLPLVLCLSATVALAAVGVATLFGAF
jgi:hypothetical protein